MKKMKKLLAGMLGAVFMGTAVFATAYASEPAAVPEPKNGAYTGEIHFLNGDGSGNRSICDPIFAHEADVILTDEEAEITFYVAYPVPNFPQAGADGTIKDVVLTADGKDYEAKSDITSKEEKIFDTAGVMFGISAGDRLSTQALTVAVPRDVLADLDKGTVSVSAYVNVVMNSTQSFYMQVTDLQPAGEDVPSSDSYTKNGTFHIDQFGEYDINAAVTVTDGKISNVDITGDHFGGTYGEVNKGKLASAVNGMLEGFIGLRDDDAQAIADLDTVSGATYSSNGIKSAVANALGLDIGSEQPADVPEQVPEAGIYRVTAAVRSDVVDHSLVQGDTAEAMLTVDENGQMRLSFDLVSGTDQEPLYVLGFNGYYEGNDRLGKLSMDGVAIETAQSQDYEVVTKVDMPLSGLSQYYYANGYLYVPAMSNLNGEISGIHFENGRFNVDMIITMYWDTLEKLADIPEQTGDSGQEAEPGQPGDVQDPGENDKGESGDQALENHGDGLTNVSKDAGGDHQEDLSEAVSGGDVSGVKTADETNALGYAALAILAAGCGSAAAVWRRRQKI